MVEFTGERVIPGQVNDDLWSEHISRYAFARRYAAGKKVLDAGCGTGYGSAELAQSAADVTGIDIAPEAVDYAQNAYPLPNIRFLASSCTATPFEPQSFDLIVAFEVIEHLSEYQKFVAECARLLRREGLFIVSSPNKTYYAESRAATGPNPFHDHEFEPQEFVNELSTVFTHVQLLLQNRVESFAFHPQNTFSPSDARIDGGTGNAEHAHFLVALCSFQPLSTPRSFVYVPRAANLLREREQHILLLQEELPRIKSWLASTQSERDALLEVHRQLVQLHRKQKEELETANRWAAELNQELQDAGQRIVELQSDAESLATGYQARVNELEEENIAKTAWALDTEARLSKELEEKGNQLLECLRLLEAAETTVEERTLWAQRTDAQREQLASQLNLIRSSRWLKLGRKLGLGPVVG